MLWEMDGYKDMRFAACVVLYNLEEKETVRIKEYSASFDAVYLIDNSAQDDSKRWGETENLFYHWNGGNLGLPSSFNWILDKGKERFDYICLLDQDSAFTKDSIEAIKNDIEIHKEYISANVGIVAPFVNYSGRLYSTEEKNVKVNWVITSGSFINTGIVKKENIRYDEKYFIDRCEVDFCKQLTLRNYEIWMYRGAILNQQLGDDNGTNHTSHSAERHYYIFRNRFYFNKKFFPLAKRIFLDLLQSIKHILHILFYEPDKARKIGMIYPAYEDYKTGHLGKKDFAGMMDD